MTTQTIESSVQQFVQQPARAQGRPSVKARSQGTQAVIEAGSFSWKADLAPSLGGSNLAPSPTSSFLGALAGCAVVFLKDTLAPQFGVRIHNVSATATCETDARGLLGLEGAVPDLQNVTLHLHIESPDDEEVQHLMAVWKERCPIYLAMVKPMQVEVSTRVVDWYAGY